jgi:hypothetical protein
MQASQICNWACEEEQGKRQEREEQEKSKRRELLLDWELCKIAPKCELELLKENYPREGTLVWTSPTKRSSQCTQSYQEYLASVPRA